MFLIYIKIHLQGYREHGAVQITLHRDGSAMHVYNVFYDGKSQTGSSGMGGAGSSSAGIT